MGASVLRVILAPAAVVVMAATLERTKMRAIVARWTRPARLILRAFVSRSIYATRSLRRLPRRGLALLRTAIRRLLIVPARWILQRTKLRLHALLVWRKGEADHAP